MKLVTRNRVVLLVLFVAVVLGFLGLYGLWSRGEEFVSRVTSVFSSTREEKGSLSSSSEVLESKAALELYERAKRYTVFILNESLAKDPTAPEGVHFSSSLGSGFSIKDGGKHYIITANHVVDKGELFYIQFPEQRKLHPARRIGFDRLFDLAVLELVDSEVAAGGYAKLGNSNSIKVSDQIYVFGSPLGMKFTWSMGRIMQSRIHVNRTNFRSGFIASDATCNPGNSGGPAINAKGEVIGIVDAIAGNNPICLIIPVNNFIKLWPKLKAGGEVRHGSLGLSMFNAWEVTTLRRKLFEFQTAFGEEGLVVVNTVPGSPANMAGIQKGDVLLRYGPAGHEPKQEVTDLAEFIEEMNLNFFRGDKIAVIVKRGDKFLLFELELVDATTPLPPVSEQNKGEEKKDQTPKTPPATPPPSVQPPVPPGFPPGGGPAMPPEPKAPIPEKPPANEFGY